MLPGSPFSLGLGVHSLTPSPFFWGAQARPLGEAQQAGGLCAWVGVVEVAAPPSASIHSPGWHPPLRCQSFGGLVPHPNPEEMNAGVEILHSSAAHWEPSTQPSSAPTLLVRPSWVQRGHSQQLGISALITPSAFPICGQRAGNGYRVSVKSEAGCPASLPLTVCPPRLRVPQGVTFRQPGWTISLQIVHSMRLKANFSSSPSTVSSFPASPHKRHTAVCGSTGCWGEGHQGPRKQATGERPFFLGTLASCWRRFRTCGPSWIRS